MQTNENIKALFQKYIDKTISDEELVYLYEYFQIEKNETQLDQLIQQFYASQDDEEISEIKHKAERVKANAWNKVNSRLEKPTHHHSNRKLWWWTAAASILVTIGASIYFLRTDNFNDQEKPLLTSEYGGDVLPGTNQATITLADGQSITLEDNETGIKVGDKGISYADGEIITAEIAVQYATIRTPKGGQYRITLSDGTKVMLNAHSSLTYPINFLDKIRQIELQGEAYLEVAHHSDLPFIVQTRNQKIKVLGTDFNVKSFEDGFFETTLIEGSVSIAQINDTEDEVLLSPNQQAIIQNNQIKVKQVDSDEFSAWTQNLFVFNDQPLAYIFEQLERWYDLEFDYRESIGAERFFVRVPRDRPLSNVLQSIEQVSGLKFKIEERRVIVQEK